MANRKRNPLASFGQTIAGLFTFGKKKQQLSVLEEEAIQSPGRVILKNFFSNRLAITGLVGFFMIFTMCFGVSKFFPIDLLYSEATLKNISPGFGYLKYPAAVQKEGVKQISSGRSFSVALTNEGKLYAWGKSNNGALNIPKEIKSENIVQIAAGDDHVIALTAGGKLLGWGYNNFKQAEIPFELQSVVMLENIVQIAAGDQYSAIVTDKGNLYVWGSVLNNKLDIIPASMQGRVVKTVTSSYNMLSLLDDGTVAVTGVRGNEVSSIPTQLTDGSVKVVDIAIGYRNAIALDDKGEIHFWGSKEDNMFNIPEMDGKIVSIDGGRSHFTALTDKGTVYAWGSNVLHQTDVPEKMGPVKAVYTDYFASYAVEENGKIHAWGNNGYIFGSDELGRDLFTRLLHGGKVTLTVGAVAVLISTVIGLIVGLISGFYGGWIDNVLMRFAEIISAFPFMPLAITLSTFLGNEVSQSQRMLLIMVILGAISWPGLSRLIRGQILAEREKDFVLAAKALGIKERTIIIRHILPNIVNIVIVNMTLSYASSLLTEAGLSFLGFGILPPSPSWGNMLTGAQQSQVIEHYWWRWLIPAFSVLLAALSVNLVGDGLRDAMDPKSNEK